MFLSGFLGGRFRNIVGVIVVSVALLLLSIFKVSFVWGSKAFFLSGFCMLAPLLGAIFGLGSIGLALVFTKFLRIIFLGSFSCLTFGLPTFFAAWSLRLDSASNSYNFQKFLVNFLIPISCFLLFIFHPNVQFGWWYGLYWFIPVALYIFKMEKNTFVTFLKSTFIAHAVGSTIWCYLIPMTPERWVSLIPIVAVERFVFALGMFVVFSFMKSFVRSFGNGSFMPRRSDITHAKRVKCLRAGLGPKKLWQAGPLTEGF